MNPPLDFDIRHGINRIRLARVLNHVQRFADPLHGKGGCSAFQITVELARCLVAVFAFTLNDSSPSLDAATRFVIHCHALVEEYGQASTREALFLPDKDCWGFFFYLVTKELAPHPNTSVACEHSTLMVAKTVHFGRLANESMRTGTTIEALCECFANAQIKVLVQRARSEPALLSSSIFNSAPSVIFKPTEDSATCVFQVARFLGESLREHNVIVCSDSITRTFAKVLASCALWNGFHVGHSFPASFMQRFLPYSENGTATPGRLILAPDLRVATTFLRLVHYCAAVWQPTADEHAHCLRTELQESGEVIAVERVLDALLKNADPVGRIASEILEATVVRDSPNPCLTAEECSRILYRRESNLFAVSPRGDFSFNCITSTGAPPYYLALPACQLTPAEIICYFPNVLRIPKVWRWITQHGWTPFNIPKFLNGTRGLEGIWKLSHSTFRNWQRIAGVTFREGADEVPLPFSSKLDISPLVRAYCNAPSRGRQKQMMEMNMSRLVRSIRCHPVGEDAGYFTAMARYAAANGDLGGKILVSQVRRVDACTRTWAEMLRMTTWTLKRVVLDREVPEIDEDMSEESLAETGRENDEAGLDSAPGSGPAYFVDI